jgi:hydroxypyruvate reductase
VSARFDKSVLGPDPVHRNQILDWLEAGLAAVDPERLTADALSDRSPNETAVIAIGKAAPSMARGAASVLDIVGGVCVSDHEEPTSERFTFIVGDHPVPGEASLRAGTAVLDFARGVPTSTNMLALISGGGSSLCETPREGVRPGFLSDVTRKLLAVGASIEELNIVRAHLSAFKGGGVSRAAGRAIDTYVISDVAGADPGVVASGPTMPHPPNPEAAVEIMRHASIPIPHEVMSAMSATVGRLPVPVLTLLADGTDAARAVAASAPPPVSVSPAWLSGDVVSCLDRFLADAGPGVTVGVGETVVEVTGSGQGGRNTHAALVAAERLQGTDGVFAAFATDGLDGRSGAAGAIVDGATLSRGGDPYQALADFDSANYLSATSDLLRCGPTGTNVSDIWILWRR